MSMPLWLKEKLFQKKILFNKLQNHDKNFDDINKIYFSEHHLSHAASAFYPSPFNDACILTMDGVGEWATSTVANGYGSNLEIQKEIVKFYATKIEEEKVKLKNIYNSPKDIMTFEKIGKWSMVQVVKAFLGMPVIPGR